MNERDFVYWLQGYAEICGEAPSEQQWNMIKEHLQLCFNKVTNPLTPLEGVDIYTYDSANYPCGYPGSMMTC